MRPAVTAPRAFAQPEAPRVGVEKGFSGCFILYRFRFTPCSKCIALLVNLSIFGRMSV